jgi:hypothetical protein
MKMSGECNGRYGGGVSKADEVGLAGLRIRKNSV